MTDKQKLTQDFGYGQTSRMESMIIFIFLKKQGGIIDSEGPE